jgi:hypothetical protein
METILVMLRFIGIFTLFATLTGVVWAQSSSIEIDRIKPQRGQSILKVDSAGNVVDPDCRLMASEIAEYVAEKRVSAPIGKGAIAHHTEECNKLRETQYKLMEENKKKISEDRAREEGEKAKGKETQRSACIEKCRDSCAASCPPATITGGTAASGVTTDTGACPIVCPSREVCEKRCAK